MLYNIARYFSFAIDTKCETEIVVVLYYSIYISCIIMYQEAILLQYSNFKTCFAILAIFHLFFLYSGIRV